MTKNEWILQLRRELNLRNYASSTIETYSSCLSVFLFNYSRYNSFKSIEDIKSFLITIRNANYHKQFTATIHHFYKLVLKKPLNLSDIPYPRKTHYLPQILSLQEADRLITCTHNIKHRAILQIMYSCALRISEVVAVLIPHIDSSRRLLLVKGAKGFKDRYVYLPQQTIELLRSYVRQFKPKKFLFEGWGCQYYSTRSIQQIFRASLRKAKFYKSVTPHSLRHSRATHLCDAGIDIYKLKDFLGHNNIKTTEIYLHLSKLSLINHIEAADKILAQSLLKQLEVKVERP